MTEKTKNILSFNHKEAMDFFLKSEQYHGFELPEYFVFDCFKKSRTPLAKRPIKIACEKVYHQKNYPM